jgi:hypothetical protein
MAKGLFQFIGVSRHPNGEVAVRYANDAGRVRVLARNGHTDIEFIELERAEHVEEAMSALMDFVEDNERVDLLDVVFNEAERVGFTF